MTDISYRIATEFKSPWLGKPHVEYQLVKEFDYFDYDSSTCWGETRRVDKIIFRHKDKALVEKFLKQLGDKP